MNIITWIPGQMALDLVDDRYHDEADPWWTLGENIPGEGMKSHRTLG